MQNQIPKNWRKEQLSNLLTLIIDHRGKTPKKLGGGWSLEGIPALSAKNIKSGNIASEDDIKFVNENLYKKWMPEKLQAGDILLTSEAPLGELYYLKEKKDYVLSQRLFALRSDNKRLYSNYLYYYLQSKLGRHELLRRLSGTAAEGIRQAELRQINVFLPEDLKEQKKISTILSAFDDTIELNNKIAKTLETMAQTIFKEWFVRFRFPGHEKAEFVDSELGKIPKGWEVGKIGDLIRIISGYPFSSSLYTANKKALGIVTIKNVQDGDFVTECDSFISKEAIPSNMSSDCYLRDGNILLSLTGNVGRVCFVYGDKYLLNQRVAKLVPKRYEDLAFTYFLFRQNPMQNYLINLAKGSAQPNLSPVETSNISTIIPTKEILDQFNSIAGPLYKKIVGSRKENQKLAALRDLLLPKLMSGEVRV